MSKICGQLHPDTGNPGAVYFDRTGGVMASNVDTLCCTKPEGHKGMHGCETRTVDGNLLSIPVYEWASPKKGQPVTWTAYPHVVPIPQEEFRDLVKRVGDAYMVHVSDSTSTSG